MTFGSVQVCFQIRLVKLSTQILIRIKTGMRATQKVLVHQALGKKTLDVQEKKLFPARPMQRYFMSSFNSLFYAQVCLRALLFYNHKNATYQTLQSCNVYLRSRIQKTSGDVDSRQSDLDDLDIKQAKRIIQEIHSRGDFSGENTSRQISGDTLGPVLDVSPTLHSAKTCDPQKFALRS